VKRYSWFLGVVVFLLLVVVTLNGITTGADEEIPSGGPNRGAKLHPFATPLANSDLEGDANVAVKDGQGEFGDKAACKVRGPKILNICQLYEKKPVVLAIFPAQGEQCREILTQLDRVAALFPDVAFAAVGSRGERDDLKGERVFPVGWDRDGAIASLYGLVGCPQITFAHRGGKVLTTTRTEMTDDEIAAQVKRLR
jgi:hypothetical protein